MDYKSFESKCREFLFDTHNGIKTYRIFSDYLQRFAYGLDASCYRYIPKLVLKPKNESEVQKIIALSNLFRIPLTFRAAGTSLSGQACSDSVLVVCMQHWQDIDANEDSIWCDCGVIGVEANNALKKFGKKIGPDPATINNASIGGIFSNNSSGMCCGVKQNSYQTIKSVRVILSDGFILDTSDSKNLAEFVQSHTQMVEQILSLREDILQDKPLVQEIQRKFAIKNTTGYGLNSLCDFTDIKDILNHIFIGAEGTLGFVSRVEYFTVEDFKHKACALVFYENLSLAASAVKVLSNNQDIVSAAEIMDYACLKAVRHIAGMPEEIESVKEGNCCILIQLESNELQDLEYNIASITSKLHSIPTLFGLHFSFEPSVQEKWWKVRKGLLPISAASKRNGATVITEDICFEIESFAAGIEGITKLFGEFGFDGIIFGHALSGNVHFIITPLLDDVNQRQAFAGFMDKMVELVVGLKGSTKAEHGTGRMMAPFVEKEWGLKAYEINKRIKHIFDSQNLFNPDVIICNDPQIHIKNLKPAESIEDYLNACMECGFCEKVCPSKNLTLTPRQRIALHREITRLKNLDQLSSTQELELQELERGYKYFGIQTCATCSMCSTICPLEIDTAKIAIAQANIQSSDFAFSVATKLSRNLKSVIKVAKWSISAANTISDVVGESRAKNWSLRANKILHTPILPRYMPSANSYKLQSRFFTPEQAKQQVQPKEVLYFSSCLNRAFAPNKKADDRRTIQEVFENLCQKAGINVRYPKQLDSMCCGKAFKNYAQKSCNPLHQTLKLLLRESQNGEVPIVCDHSACSGEVLKELASLKDYEKLNVLDMPRFALETLMPRLQITPIEQNIGIYAVCALKKNKQSEFLYKIAKACTTKEVLEHTQTYCCGFAGNKGFLTPELNIEATKELAQYFTQQKAKNLYSSSSTCEIGLSDATDTPWQHIIYLLDRVSTRV